MSLGSFVRSAGLKRVGMVLKGGGREMDVLLCIGLGTFGPFCVFDGGFLGAFDGSLLGCCFGFLFATSLVWRKTKEFQDFRTCLGVTGDLLGVLTFLRHDS